MKRMLIITATIFALVALLSCKKDEKIEISQSLENSTWSSIIDVETSVQTKIEFTSASDATYSVITRGYGADITTLQVEYSYTFNQPNISLTPKSDNTPALKGYIKTLGEAYNVLQLSSEDKSIELNLTQVVDKDQTIWQ